MHEPRQAIFIQEGDAGTEVLFLRINEDQTNEHVEWSVVKHNRVSKDFVNLFSVVQNLMLDYGLVDPYPNELPFIQVRSEYLLHPRKKEA